MVTSEKSTFVRWQREREKKYSPRSRGRVQVQVVVLRSEVGDSPESSLEGLHP